MSNIMSTSAVHTSSTFCSYILDFQTFTCHDVYLKLKDLNYSSITGYDCIKM